ncbi:Leucine-rich repeat - like 10 [Theobroma cacao]|nr:Leucine-rich repeat - like 10 [Theobroma cacao]
MYLNLSDSNFAGQVPSQVSHLSKLVSLDLSQNYYQPLGRHTLEGLVENLTEARQLSLGDINMFSINPNALTNLSSSLRALNLEEEISFGNNKLKGPIPSSISQLVNLTIVDFSHLSGFVQINMFSKLQNLQYLDLSYSSLSLNSNGTSADYASPNLQYLFSSSCNVYEFPQFLKGSKMLNLQMNKFRGFIPPAFTKGCKLNYLNLNGNQLEGPFPQAIINCRGLEVLDLGNNKINDTFPHWLESLTHLQVLVLHSNQLHGSFQDPWSNHSFSKIQIFDLSNNYFTGPLPVKYIKNFKAMINLSKDKSARSYMGEYVPFALANFYSYSIEIAIKGVEIELEKIFIALTSIDLSNNEFQGEIPKVIGELDSLKGLNLSHNNLSGCIPTSMGNLTALESLDLSSNKLVGKIPTQLNSLGFLEVLNLSQNQLVGPIPQGKQFDTFGRDSYAGNLGLCGFLLSRSCDNTEAPFFHDSTEALIFHVEADSESGFVWKATFMGYGSGLLSGDIKEFQCKSLEEISFGNNKLKGPIPSSISQLVNLTIVDFSHLSGFVQINMFSKLENLLYLDLSYNSLSLNSNGTSADYVFPNLQYLYLSSCNLPSLLCNANSFEFLDLSRNNLSGIIPQCFGNLSQSLLVLNLQMNKFRGFIPPAFTKGCKLNYLNLNGNQLEGPFPQAIINCRGLEVLDLGNNKINDTFPHWLESLTHLQVLVLHSNQLHGSFQDPWSNHSFSKIQIFDLSNNYFTGPLPVKYIKNFKAMINLSKDKSARSYMGEYVPFALANFYSYSIEIAIKGVEIELEKIFIALTSIDLSNNEFQGEIPKVIGELDSLKGLNLSHNNLSGCIPTSMGNLTALESLDLSSNKLVGKIPTQLNSLGFLEVLNLSQNQLVGPIPQGKQFDTFGRDSYAGNLGLCGFLLSRSCDNTEAPFFHDSTEALIFHVEADSESGFVWKATFMGYGSGLSTAGKQKDLTASNSQCFNTGHLVTFLIKSSKQKEISGRDRYP